MIAIVRINLCEIVIQQAFEKISRKWLRVLGALSSKVVSGTLSGARRSNCMYRPFAFKLIKASALGMNVAYLHIVCPKT